MNQKEVRKNIKRIKTEMNGLNDKIEILNGELKGIIEFCTHNKTKTEKSYFSGSYSDCAYTTYRVYCEYCGNKINEYDVEHNWFG